MDTVEHRPLVLCIEDEPEVIDLIRLILNSAGFRVEGAVGGENGLEAARALEPDVVLLDLIMPDMDGWDVYQRIRADSVLADVPVIVVTAKSQSIDKVLGYHIAKVDDYVTKPFEPQDLVQRVQQVLGPGAEGASNQDAR